MLSGLPSNVELENCLCPNACLQGDEFVVEDYDRLHNLPGRFQVVRCKGCGLMRTSPRPTQSTIGFYYPDDYAPFHSVAKKKEKRQGATPSWTKRISSVLKLEDRCLPVMPPGRLLEIGCADGEWLKSLDDSGWDVRGIEFSAKAAARARKRGLHVEATSIETATAPDKPFDVIAAWMVFEHLHHPELALQKIKSWLSPSGYLVASIPDSGALPRRIFREKSYDLQLPTHLFHFTPATFGELLHINGWNVTSIRWQRNANTFLKSAEYFAQDHQLTLLSSVLLELRTHPIFRPFRIFLNLLFGITRQSGRIEVWAQPLNASERSTT